MNSHCVLFFMLCLAGCAKAYQPVPPSYERWVKTGSIELDVKKVLLGCGFPHPTGETVSSERPLNEVVLTHRCIVNAGYVYTNPITGEQDLNNEMWCSNRPDLPACQPDAIIPTPSVERRLNSPYCQRRTSYQACYDDFLKRRENYCQALKYPHWNGPVDWLGEQDCEAAQVRRAADHCGRGDYSKLPPECLP